MGKQSRRRRPGEPEQQRASQERCRARTLEQSAQIRALHSRANNEVAKDHFEMSGVKAVIVDRGKQLRKEAFTDDARGVLDEVVRVAAPVCRHFAAPDDPHGLVSTIGMPLVGSPDILCGWPRSMSSQAAELVADLVADAMSGSSGSCLRPGKVVDHTELCVTYTVSALDPAEEAEVPGHDLRMRSKQLWPFEGASLVRVDLLAYFREGVVLPGSPNAAPLLLRNTETGEAQETGLIMLPRPSAMYRKIGAGFSVARLTKPGPPSGEHRIISPAEFHAYELPGLQWCCPREERFMKMWGVAETALLDVHLKNADPCRINKPAPLAAVPAQAGEEN